MPAYCCLHSGMKNTLTPSYCTVDGAVHSPWEWILMHGAATTSALRCISAFGEGQTAPVQLRYSPRTTHSPPKKPGERERAPEWAIGSSAGCESCAV